MLGRQPRACGCRKVEGRHPVRLSSATAQDSRAESGAVGRHHNRRCSAAPERCADCRQAVVCYARLPASRGACSGVPCTRTPSKNAPRTRGAAKLTRALFLAARRTASSASYRAWSTSKGSSRRLPGHRTSRHKMRVERPLTRTSLRYGPTPSFSTPRYVACSTHTRSVFPWHAAGRSARPHLLLPLRRGPS